MATIVERPMSALSDIQTSPRQPRRGSIEIIDVDSFEHMEGSSSQPQRTRTAPRPMQRRTWSQPETISLVDSDDEDIEIFPQVLSSHGVARNRSHRRLISPPSRTSSIPSFPPPVPRMHPRYASQTSLPMRRHAPPFPSPPVVPSTQPFAFEQFTEPPVAGPSNPRRTAPQAAPVSHHVPAMGLGGAFISSIRAQSTQRPARSAAITRRGSAIPNRETARALHFALMLNDFEEDLPHVQTYLNNRDFDDDDFDAPFQPQPRWTDSIQRRWAKNTHEREDYQQFYTHPSQPEPGFTFDFAIPSPEDEDMPRSRFFPPTSIHEPIILDDDDDRPSKPTAGPSSSSGARESTPGAGQLNALLVCAKCLDPLILNAGLDPEEAQYRRVWGLRCGHLIDEKCLNELGQPPEEEESMKDLKGKGKAKAMHKHTYGDAVPELQSLAEAEVPNIRSRLRSRVAKLFQGQSSTEADTETSSLPAAEIVPTSPPTKKRRVSNKKPKIEGKFEWHCPVTNCGKVHVSVKIDGIWGPEKQRDFKGVKGLQTEARGAVAVFA